MTKRRTAHHRLAQNTHTAPHIPVMDDGGTNPPQHALGPESFECSTGSCFARVLCMSYIQQNGFVGVAMRPGGGDHCFIGMLGRYVKAVHRRPGEARP